MNSDADIKVYAGKTGDGPAPFGVRAYAIGAVATTIVIPEFVGATPAGQGVWLEWCADVEWYVTVGSVGFLDIPDPAAVDAVNPQGQCVRVPADRLWQRWFDHSRTRVSVISGADGPGILRCERVSVIFGGDNEGA
jgi:hypothetical protein